MPGAHVSTPDAKLAVEAMAALGTRWRIRADKAGSEVEESYWNDMATAMWEARDRIRHAVNAADDNDLNWWNEEEQHGPA
jgi:hypothetical protein